MKTEKTIGILLTVSAIGLLIPYTTLSIIFEYPVILRQDTAVILAKFKQGGNTLIWTWFAFAVTGIPLIPAYILLGRKLQNRSVLVNIATKIGLIGLIVQMIGLLRWTFVVPMLANAYANTTDESTHAAIIIAFKTIHQFAGVLLGEHLGQLFTITWTILITIVLAKLKLMPKWISALGIVSSLIYFMAQAELFATVMPNFPVWNMAGFMGSTLWLAWLIVIGIKLLKSDLSDTINHN